ncbi:7-cyano-7-deazaguanine synthase QueC [Candidatus Aciduliprofundum boonei]|uniref:7-cyano-7-deazaguanine synthase n=1 Tax=Aciduliprofundum boonei (strain DSM 19572 / T469) TaxID=439481 RepID=B5I9Q6_ACIB4|nr:7-cyano-7-deazaguanine synthase QueC [Candidatus Aciduliprofundum boonei]ADD08468.1 exsB protein [Aciduliprofundum boonei T469]EDY36339.1 exsB protein [Aciduliprofundum boonei T469]EDY36830.1 exsB protein [Aciduliprofundum boonei T469]HII55327.1 7-cyano-7-deazaguanine synthase QueC [Candidatus Aciduliprofundum boonei]
MKAVVLLSGGLDSSTVLAIALEMGYDVHALSFDYGQRHSRELESAKKIARYFNVPHKIIKIDLRQIGGSALTDNIEVPERQVEDIEKEIPITYVPARNTILLSLALGYAEVIDADAIFYGANAIDYSGYPDCRPEYVEAFERVANLGTKRGVEGKPIKIIAPIIHMTKAEIIKKGMELGVPYELTWSCYRGEKKACGKCDSCLLRLKGFMEAGYEDPLDYETYPEFYIEYLKKKGKK